MSFSWSKSWQNYKFSWNSWLASNSINDRTREHNHTGMCLKLSGANFKRNQSDLIGLFCFRLEWPNQFPRNTKKSHWAPKYCEIVMFVTEKTPDNAQLYSFFWAITIHSLYHRTSTRTMSTIECCDVTPLLTAFLQTIIKILVEFGHLFFWITPRKAIVTLLR